MSPHIYRLSVMVYNRHQRLFNVAMQLAAEKSDYSHVMEEMEFLTDLQDLILRKEETP